MSHSKRSAYQVYSSSVKKSNDKKHSDSYGDRKEKNRIKKHSRDKNVSSDSDDDVLRMNQPRSLMSFKEEENTGSRRHTSSSSKHKKHKSRSHRKKNASSSSDDDSEDDVRSRSYSKKSKYNSDTGEDDGDYRHDSAEENGREKRSWRTSSTSRHSLRPVVVDMSRKNYDREEDYRSSNADRRPKSLFDTYIPALKKMKPVSLLALPNDTVPTNRYGQSSYNSKDSYSRHSYNSRESYNRGGYSSRGSFNHDGNFSKGAYNHDGNYFKGPYNNDNNYSKGSFNHDVAYSKRPHNHENFNSKDSFNHERRRGSDGNKRKNYNSDDEHSSKRFNRNRDDRTSEAHSKESATLWDKSRNHCRITASNTGKQSFLVIPSSCPSTGLHGRARVTVLLGSVKILGYQLSPNKAYPVYSPLTGGLLSLHASGDKLTAQQVKEELAKHGFTDLDKTLNRVEDNSIAVVLVSRLESTLCDYITTFIPYTQMFTARTGRDDFVGWPQGVTLNKVGLRVAPHAEFSPPCLDSNVHQEDILNKWTKLLKEPGEEPAVVMCCGPKNTGKSTFNRMLVNTALQSVPCVAYLECDVGQTEFSPPATVALHLLTQPILDPPFCHQLPAERMVFYGEVMPGTDPSMYVRCLKYVYQAYLDLATPTPLIVNTMGWVDGVGLMLLIDTIHLSKPNLLVQLESNNQSLNPLALTHETVALDPGWTVNKTPPKDPAQQMEETHKHDLVLLSATVPNPNRRDMSLKLKPVDLRNLCLLSCLSQGLEPDVSLTSMTPLCLPYHRLAIHVCHYKVATAETLTAINASLVALCVHDISQLSKENNTEPYILEEMPICECLGLGIVRGVDVEKGLLYLVTSLPACELRRVNTLLKGSLAIPDQLMLKQKSVGAVPYVDALAASTAMTPLRQRSRMPRNSLRC